MRAFDVVAAQDMPSYGAFTVLAADPAAALAAAAARLLADQSMLCEHEAEGAHSLRIVSLQEHDQDPLYEDVSLDPEAPLWPGPAHRSALLATTCLLAHLVVSLGEAGEYPNVLDRLQANLGLLGPEDPDTLCLARVRADMATEGWAEQVMQWGFSRLGEH